MQLTKAEEQLMHILWGIGKGTVQDILQRFDEPKPARTTVSTVLSILEGKNFVEHETVGRVNIYWAIVPKEEYSKKQLSSMVKNYFNGSFATMISFFAKENNLSIEDMDKIIGEIRDDLDNE